MADMIDSGDVNRYLKSTAEAANLVPYIAAAIEAIQNLTGRTWSDSVSSKEEVFYNVRDGAILYLDDIAPTTVTKVEVFARGSTVSTELTVDVQYQVLDRGRVHLLTLATILITWARVIVTYTPSGSVPQIVQEAAAVLAASMYAQAKGSSSGLKSEKLGDYGYTKNESVEGGDLLPAVRRRLTVYNRKRRARTT